MNQQPLDYRPPEPKEVKIYPMWIIFAFAIGYAAIVWLLMD